MANENNTTAFAPDGQQGRGRINFAKTILSKDLLPGDIYQYELKGDMILPPPDRETFGTYFKEDTEPAKVDQLYDVVNMNYKLYKERKFDPWVTKSTYQQEGVNYRPGEMPSEKWSNPVMADFTQETSPSVYRTAAGDEITRKHAQQVAKDNGIFRTNDGRVLPLELYDGARDGYLVEEFSDKYKTNIWRAAKDGELIDPTKIRPAMGAAELESNSWASMGRGFLSGVWGQAIKGVGGTLSLVNDGFSGLVATFGSRTFDEVASSSMLHNMAIDAYNYSNFQTRMNADEQESMFKSWNSFVYQLSNGIGQFVPMIATSAAGGGVGLGIGKLASSVGGKTLAKRIGADATAAFASKMYGSMVVFGYTSEELERLGYSREDALLTAYLFAAGTFASESIFAANLNEKLGWKLANTYMRRVDQQTTLGIAKTVTKNNAAKQKLVDGIEQKINKGTFGYAIGRGEKMSALKRFGRMRRELFQLGDDAPLLKTLAFTGGEEAIEEGIEGLFHKWTAQFFNQAQKDAAWNNKIMYDGMKITPMGEGDYRVEYASGKTEVVDLEEKLAIDVAREHTDRILNGENLLDDNFNYDEMVIAGLAASMTGGVLTHMTHQTNKKRGQQFFAMGLEVSKNPTKIAEIDRVVDQWLAQGLINEQEANGFTDKEGNVIPGLRDDVKQSVQLLADQIKASGITNPAVMKVLGQDVPLMKELYDNMQHDEKLTAAIDTLEAADDGAPPEQIKTILASHVDGVMIQENDNLDVLKERQAEIRAKIKSLTTVKQNPDGSPMTYETAAGPKTAETSERYTARMNKVMALDAVVKKQATELADSRSKFKTWFNETLGGKKYEAAKRQQFIDKKAKKLKNDLVKLTQLRFANLRTSEPYEFLKEWVVNFLPTVGKSVDEFKNTLVKEMELTPEEAADVTQRLDDLSKSFEEEVEIEVPGEKTETGEAKPTTKKISLASLINEVGTRDINEIMGVLANNASLQLGLSNITGHMTQLANYFDEDALPYRASIKPEFGRMKEQFQKYFKMLQAFDEYEEEGGTQKEILDMKEAIFAEGQASAMTVNQMFKEFDENQVGLHTEILEQDIVENQKISDIDGQAMLDQLKAIFSNDPVLANLFGDDFTNGVGAVLNVMVRNGIILDEGSNATRVFGSLFPEIAALMGNKKAKITDPDQIYNDTIGLLNVVNQVDTYLDLMEMTNDELYAKNNLREHAIISPKENMDKKLSEAEIKTLRDINSKIRDRLAEWQEDERLKDVKGKNAEYKARVAHLANRIAALNFIYTAPELELSDDDKVKLNTILEQIDEALKNETTELNDITNDKNAPPVTAEKLALKYFSLREAENKRKLEVFTARIEGHVDRAEEILSGKLDKVIAGFKKAYSKSVLFSKVFRESLFDTSTPFISGYYSLKTYNNGKVHYERARANGQTFSESLPDDADGEVANKEVEFFVQTTLSHMVQINTFGSKVDGVVMPTKRQVLKIYRDIVGELKGTDRPIETWEQVNQLFELVAAYLTDNENPLDNKNQGNFPHAVLLGGYAGTGKSDVSSVALTILLSKMFAKKMKVTVIVPTGHLEEDYQKREKKIIDKFGADSVEFEYIFLDKLSVDDKKIKDADIIFAEEVSMYSDTADNSESDIDLIMAIQEKHKNKMFLIGDEGQVGSAEVQKQSGVVFDTSHKITPLTQVFRTGVTGIFLLQEKFRNWSDPGVDTFVDAATSTFKVYENGDKAGVRYVPKNVAKKEVIAGFVDARQKGKDAILILTTYAERDKLLAENANLENYKAYIKVLEYDSDKIRDNDKLRDLNVAGMKADEVYIPFSPEEIIVGGNIDVVYKDSGIGEGHFELANRMMLSAVSRASRFVMMGSQNGKSEDLTGTENIIPGYDDVVKKTETEANTEEQTVVDITPDELRNRRINDVNERIGNVKTFNINGEDIEEEPEVVTTDEGDNLPPAEKPVDTTPPPPADTKPKHKVPVDPDSVLTSRFDNVTVVIQQMQKAAADMRKGRFAGQATDVVDQVYEDAFGKSTDELSQLRGRTLRAALNVVLEGDNVKPATIKEYEKALAEYFDASKRTKNFKPETYEKMKSGLRNNILQTMSEIAFDEKFVDDGMFVGNPKLQKSGKRGSPFVMKVVGIADDGSPIVDIYVVASKVKDIQTLDKFDPKMINRRKLARYAALAGQKGYKVNQLKMIQVVDDYSGSFSQGTTFTMNDQEATKMIMKEAKALFGKTPTPGTMIVSMEDLYNVQRKIDQAPAFGGIITAGDGFIENNTMKDAFVEEIQLQYKDGKWEYTFLIKDSQGKLKKMSRDEIETALRPTYVGAKQQPFKRNALAFKNNKEIFSSTMIIPADVKVKKKGFWDKGNDWLAKKRKLVRYLKNAKIEEFDKVYVNGYQFQRPDVDGNITVVTQDHAIINEIRSDDIVDAAKHLGLSVDDFVKAGFNVVSIDAQPELGFKKIDPKTKKVITGRNEMQEQNSVAFNKWVRDGKITKEIVKAIEDSFRTEQDPEIFKALVEYNIHKLEILQKGYKAFTGQTGSNVVYLGTSFIRTIDESPLMMIGADDNFTSGQKLIDNLEKQGLRHISTTLISPSGQRKHFLMKFEDENNNIVEIRANARRFSSKEEWKKYLDDAIKELDSKNTAFANLAAQYDAIAMPELEDQEAMAKWQAERNRVMKKLYPIFMENKANSLLLHNKNKIGQMIAEQQRSSHRRLAVHSTTDRINVKGYSMADRIRLLKQQLSGMKNMDHKEFYIPVFTPTKQGKAKEFEVNPADIVTPVVAVLQPQIYTDSRIIGLTAESTPADQTAIPKADPNQLSEDPDEDTEFMDNLQIKGKQYTFVDDQEAIRQLIAIFGPEVFSILNIDTEEVYHKGKLSFGQVYKGMIRLANTRAGIESTTPRHEAMHFIVEYLMDEKNQKRLFERSRQEMVKLGLASSAADISYQDVHEWLADKYGEGMYFGGKPFNTSTYWGKVMEFFRRVFLKFRLATSSDAILTTFARADLGHFALNMNEIDDTGEMIFHNTAENDLTRPINIEMIDNVFGGWQFAKDMVDRYISSNILLNSKFGKSVQIPGAPISFKGSGPNHFNKAVKITIENIIEQNDLNEDRTFSYIDKNGNTIKVSHDDLTIEHYMAAREGEKAYVNSNRTQERVNNGYVIEAYFYKTLVDGVEYVVSEEIDGKAVSETFPFSGEEILLTLIQEKFPGLNISSINYDERNGGMVSTSQNHLMLNKELVNPLNSLSSFIKFLIGQVPYRIVRSNFENIVSDNPSTLKMNGRIADKVFLDVAAELRARGMYPTNENFFSLLREFAEGDSPSIYKNTAYSLSVYFGYNMSMKQDDQIAGRNGQNVFDGQEHELSQQYSLDGIGYMNLIGKSKNWLRHNLGLTETQAEDLIKRQKNFEEVVNGIVDHYTSLANTVHFKIIENGRNNIRVQRSRSLDKTHTNNRIVLSTQASMFNQSDSFLKKESREQFDGPNKKYDVRGTGLYLKGESGKFSKIMDFKNGKATRPASMSKREHVIAVQEFLNDIFPNQKISQPVVAGILGYKAGQKKANDIIMTQIYYMALTLKKTAIDSNVWYNTPADKVYVQPRESKDIQRKLDIYIANNSGVQKPAVQESPRREDRNKVDNQIVVYSHLQFTDFIHDFLSEQISKGNNNSASRTLYTVDGERRYAYQQTSTLSDAFPNSGFDNPSTQVMKANVDRKINKALQDGFDDVIERSPIVTRKGKEIVYNDPILNGSITFDYIGEYDGRVTPWGSQTATHLSQEQYLKDLMQLTKTALKKNNRIVPAFLETQSDRSKISMVSWISGNLFRINQNAQKEITYVGINPERFATIARDLVRYAHARMRISGKDISQYNAFANVNLKKFETLFNKGDFKGAMDLVTKAFDSDWIAFQKTMDDAKLSSEGARIVEKAEFDETEILDALKKFGIDTSNYEKEFDAIHEAIDNGDGITSGELIKARGRMRFQLSQIRKANEAYTVKNSDFYLETMKPLNELFEKIIPKGAAKTREADQLMKVMFWSHNFINNSVNHLIRGDVSKYKGFTDYIKRGVGLDATGSTYNHNIIGKKHRVLLMDDPLLKSKLFNGNVKITDGLRWVNPVIHALFAISKGGSLGSISYSAQKNVHFNYESIGDELSYYKMSDVPINYSYLQDPYYQDLLKVMLGSELFNKYGAQLTAGIHGYRTAIQEIATNIQKELRLNDGESETLNKMVSVIAHVETQKGSLGKDKIFQYSITEDDGVTEIRLDHTLNKDENVSIVPTENLRLQQISGGFQQGKRRPVLTQQNNIASAGWWNRDIATKISTALMASVDSKNQTVLDNMNNPRMMADDIIARNRTKGAGHKLFRVANNPNVDVNVYKLKAIQSQLTEMNEALKPKVPGSSLIQTPYMGHVYERNGQVYTSQDLDFDTLENWKERGYKKRMLAPLQFILNGKIIDSYQELIDNPTAKALPQEVMMPFTYYEKFGISIGNQPQKIMTTGKPGSRKNHMTRRTEAKHLPEKMIYDNMIEYLDVDAVEFLQLFDKDIQRFVIKKMVAKGILEVPADRTTDYLEYFYNEGNDQFSKTEVKEAFLQRTANYLRLLNLSLDLFAGRIPGTNASSGFPTRIVGFLWDSDNTVLYPAEKNILDGSDNDIDELHVQNRALVVGTKKEVELTKNQNKIFTALWSYYNEARNYPLILQKVGPEELIALADKYPAEVKSKEADVNTSAREREINMSGKNLVGHFANLQTVLLRMMQISPTRRKEIFSNINSVINQNKAGETRTSPLLQNDVESLMELMHSTSLLINAATDNSKLGGILGRLGINETTSNLVAGFVAAGYSLEDIAEIFKDEEVSDFIMSAKGSRTPLYEILDGAVDDNATDLMKQIKQASLIGEQLRRMTEIIRLQQGIGTDLYSLYQSKSNFQKYFGQSSLQNVTDILNQNDRRDFTGNENVEEKVLASMNMFDIVNELPLLKSYLNILNTTYNYVNESFVVTPETELFKTIEAKTKYGVINFKKAFNEVMHEMDRLFMGRYLDTLTSVRMGETATYNFADIKKRFDFIVDSVEHIKQLKVKYKNNKFVASFDYDAGEMGIPIYKFSDNLNKDDKEKSFLTLEFERIDEADKEFFRMYQLLVYGFQFTTGSFYEMMDDQLEERYSDWLGTANVDAILNDTKNVDEIIARTSGFLPDRVTNEYSREVDTKGRFRSRKRVTVKVDDGEKTIVKPVSTPYPKDFNNHGKMNTVFNYPVLDDMNYNQEISETPTNVKINGINRIRTETREVVKSYFNDIYAGDLAVTPNGIVSVVPVNWNNISVKKVADLGVTPDLKVKDSRVRSYNISGNVLNDLVQKIQKAFPNIGIILVNNENADRKGIAGWMQNGQIYINTDLVQADTPFHEYSHIVLGIIKQTRYDTYFDLLKMAAQLVNSDDPLAQSIYDLYPDLSVNDRLEEVVAGILGIRNAEMAEKRYMGLIGDKGYSAARAFWERVKALVLNAWESFMTIFKTAYGADVITGEFNSIEDFSKKVFRAINRGQAITGLSSTEFTHLVGSFTKDSRITKIKSLGDMLIHLDNPKNDPAFDKINRNNHAAGIINIIQSPQFNGKVPAHVFGKEIEVKNYESLRPTDPLVQSIVSDALANNKAKQEKLISLVSGAFEESGYFTDPQGKQGYLNEMYGKRQNGKPVVTTDMIDNFLKSIDFNTTTKYMTLEEYNTTHNLDLDLTGLNDMTIMVGVEMTDENQEVISLYPVTMLRPANTYTGDGSVLISTQFSVDEKKAKVRGLTMRNNTIGKASIAVAYLAAVIGKKNPKVKVRSAALLRPVFSRKTYYGIDIGQVSREMKALVAFDEVSEYMDPVVKNTLINTGAASFNWGLYLDNLNQTDDQNTPFVALPFNTQLDLINNKMRNLIEKVVEGSALSQEEEQELSMLSQYYATLNNGQLTDKQVNSHPGKINRITRFMFDQNAIGERNFNILRQSILNSANKIVLESNKVKDSLAKVHNKVLDHKGVSRAERSVSNRSKEIWGELFDTIIDSEGDERRTGMIYWSNNLKDAKNDTERQLIIRAQQKGVSDEMIAAGRAYTQVVEDLLLESVEHQKKLYGYDVKRSWTREELLEELYSSSSYKRGFIPVMGSNVNELLASGNIGKAVARQTRQVLDMTTLMNEIPDYATMEKDQEYVTRIKDMMFQQVGYRETAMGYTPFGAARRMNNFLGLKQVYDASGNAQWVTQDAKRNDNVSYDIENMLDYFTVATKRVIIHEQKTLPIINAVKYGLKIKQQFQNMDNSTIIKHIDDYVDAMVLGIRQDETGGAQLGAVKIGNFFEVVNAVARPLVMALNPNIAILSASSNFMLSLTDAIASSIANTSTFGVKEMAQASVLYNTDKKKASRIARYYQVINQTEYDLLHHYTTKTVDKNLVSSFGSNYLNWYVDNAARTTIMIAQMLKDGTWDAHSVDSDGNVQYDPDKDARFKDRATNNKQNILYEHIQARAEAEGYDKGTRAYDFQEARKFKILSERKTTGAFGAESRSVLNNYVLGRALMMFSSWFVSRVSDAFSPDQYSKEAGRWVVETIEGKEVPVWEEAFIEGYMITTMKTIGKVFTFDFKELQNMSPDEKKNLVKTMVIFSQYFLILGVFNAIKALGEDDKKYAKAKEVTDMRAVYNMMIAADGMIILPSLLQKFDSPFAGISILGRGLFNGFGEYSWKNTKHLIPFRRTYNFFDDFVEVFSGDTLYENLTK